VYLGKPLNITKVIGLARRKSSLKTTFGIIRRERVAAVTAIPLRALVWLRAAALAKRHAGPFLSETDAIAVTVVI
jgi:non-ribosomal peptide synthetase component E (peptide arylation enzyme)